MLKKIIYLIVSGGLLLSGCSLDYEPLNGPSSGSFPASEEEAMAGLYAAYKGLANMTVKETPFPMRINDCISDIGTYRTGAGNQIKAMSSTLTADNTMCEKVYKTVYKIAGRVHLVLDNLDRLRGVIPEDRFNQIKSRTALYPRLLLRLGVPVLRRHPLHRPPARSGRLLRLSAYPARAGDRAAVAGSRRRPARLPARAVESGHLRYDAHRPCGRLRPSKRASR